MDRMQPGGPYTRPYQTTCGMQDHIYGKPMARENGFQSGKKEMEQSSSDPTIYDVLCTLPLAMAYVPKQCMHKTLPHSEMLQHGTIFPELCLPFTGKRGGYRC